MKSTLLLIVLIAGCGSKGAGQIAPEPGPEDPAVPVADEVPDAGDAPSPGQSSSSTAVERCSTQIGGAYMAEHEYPGRSVADLARVVVIIELPKDLPAAARYSNAVPAAKYLRAGGVGVPCAQGTEVTFIGP